VTQPITLGPEGERAWSDLRRHVEWAEDHWLAFVFSGSVAQSSVLRERLGEAFVDLSVVTLHPRTPESLRALPDSLMDALDAADLVWVECIASDPPSTDEGQPWAEAWRWVMMRLNERRGLLSRSGAPLILAAAHELKITFREAAPDLWSVRALVLELPLRERMAPPLDIPGGNDTNSRRMAEIVLRLGYHLGTGDRTWLAFVESATRTPLDALRTALEQRCGEDEVPFRASTRLPRSLTPGGLHWVDLETLEPATVSALPEASAGVVVTGPIGLSEAVMASHLADQVAFVTRLEPDLPAAARPLPELRDVQSVVRTAQSALVHARSLDGVGDPRAVHAQLQAMSAASEALLDQGWTSEAAPIVADLVALARTAHAEHPDDRGIRRLAAVAEELAAGVARDQGDLEEAKQSLQAALSLRESLVEGLSRRREVATCTSRLGEIAREQGDLDTALHLLSAARDIRVELAAAGDVDARSLLATSHSLLGDLHLARGDLVAARSAFERALSVRTAIAAETTNPAHRRLQAIAWLHMGRVLERAGDLAAARAAFARALLRYRDLIATVPGHATWQAETAMALSRLGDVALAERDHDSARQAWEEALCIRAELADADPENARWAAALAVSLVRLARLEIEQGQTRLARGRVRRASEITTQLAWLDPSNSSWNDLHAETTELLHSLSNGDQP